MRPAVSLKTDVKKILKSLAQKGWNITAGRNSYKCHHPKGDIVFIALTPSDQRAIQNIEGYIKRVERKYGQA